MSKGKLTSNKEPERLIEHDLFGTNPRKKGINSKKKGNANELECAKFLKEWTGLEFNRVPQSGGLRWKNSEGVTGDLVCEDRTFPFSVETKHYKKIVFKPKLPATSFVFKVWDQAQQDADRANKHPLVILRQNGMPKGEYMVYLDSNIVCKYLEKLAGQEMLKAMLKGTELDTNLDRFDHISSGHTKDLKFIVGYKSTDFVKTFDYKLLVESLKS